MVKNIYIKLLSKIQKRIKSYLVRRPHRSFRRTRRRDYGRSLILPGYFKFNKYVFDTIWSNRKIFICLTLTIAIISAAMVGISSQENFSTLKDTLDTTSKDFLKGNWGEAGKAGLLFISTINGSLSGDLTESQQIYSGIIILIAWLATVWLLRNILAGRKVKMRDGLYNSASPILSTFIVAMLFVIQLLPAAIAIIGYSAASSTKLLTGGIEAMLFWIAAGLLVVMSLYFIIGTFFALIIVTLPGMYPSIAVKTAGDLVVGRRTRLLMRVLWMAAEVVIVWAIIMIPVIMIDSWIKNMWKAASWVPSVPVIILGLSSITVIWVASYIYLLYRKVVNDESAPA